jgi:hypothetical protein
MPPAALAVPPPMPRMPTMRTPETAMSFVRATISRLRVAGAGCGGDPVGTKEAADECVVCMYPKRLVTSKPCGHAVMCAKCAKEVASKYGECPMCRTKMV